METNGIVNTLAYHGTCSKFSDSIRENGLDPDKVKYRENHWLGQGVYFYDKFDRAMWWASDQAGKPWNQGSYPTVYQSTIEATSDKILDLDNSEQLDKFYDAILESIDVIENSGKYPIFDSSTYRAVYFDYYKIQNDIAVIIYTFHKEIAGYGKARVKNEVEKIKELSHSLGLEYAEKQICVSKKECIKFTELVYNGEDEVI